jgi:thiamine-monophosphate kinase
VTTLRKTSERELLKTLARLSRTKKASTRGVVVGIGDDAAVLRPGVERDLLLTTDVLVEGRHFHRDWFEGNELGWRLAAVNLSDIAAMGGRPLYGVLSLALPRGIDIEYVKGIQRGVRDHLAAFGATIVGGNISGIADTIVCDLTLVGWCAKGKAWRRRCRPDRDAVVVVGNLGEARAGLTVLGNNGDWEKSKRVVQAFKRPKPLLDVAELLRDEKAVRGAIDVSDGFSLDLIRMCEAGKAGVEIEARWLPLSKSLQIFCLEYGKASQRCVLEGGEDYALILSVDRKKAEAVVERIRRRLGVPACVVGYFTGRRGRYELIGDRGRRMPLVARGFDHLATLA